MRLADVADALGLEVDGDGEILVGGVGAVDDAIEGDLTFVRSAAFAARLAESGASAVVALPSLDVAGMPSIRSPDPSRDFYRAAALILPTLRAEPGVHPTAIVDPAAEIDATASVGPHCFVGPDVRVGARTVLRPGVVLHAGVQVGADCELNAHVVITAASILHDRVILQPGAVIGGEGFGYVGSGTGGMERAHNVGRVILEEGVEVGANTTIDRGTLGDTRIGRSTKIDNQVQIAHNCQIGAGVMIAAHVGIAGSSVIADGVILMGQAGVGGHLRIGTKAFVTAKAGVTKDVPDGTVVSWFPQRERGRHHREMASLTRLPDLLRRVRALEKLALGKAGGSEEDA